MKKIFAIALALVMVLSMASAFAWKVECETRNYAWNCDVDETYCGQGKVEVVPYVVVNATACEDDGYKFVESECAAAVNTTEVFYAIRLTVDAYPDTDWWYAAELVIETEGVKLPAKTQYKDAYTPKGQIDKILADEDLYTEEQVLYLAADGQSWINEEDDAFELEKVVVRAKVVEAENAEVCATLTSENDGVGVYEWEDYVVTVEEGGTYTVNQTTYECDYNITFEDEDGKYEVVMWVYDGKVLAIDALGASKAFYNAVNTDFNLDACTIGTCVGADDIQYNFGWEDEIKDCLTWNTEAASVVNAECIVAIPKTGDASVLAWLF
ncbi:MAG: hypothetical protein IJN83_02315 [Clostridia bacterium]|nr:hypothetical protein [Clostridia bacterium]